MRIARLAGFTGLAATAAAAGTLAFSGTALAQVGGCPSGGGWFLASTGSIAPSLDNGNFKDQNGDGWVCFRLNPGQAAKHGIGSYTVKDNTNPIR